MTLPNLPEPDFIERDADKALRESVAFVEGLLERPLEPEQFERIMIDLIVYREMLVRHGIQEAAKLNLVAFSRYPMIDHLTRLVGIERLPAAAARTPLVFAFAPLAAPLPIPAGFRVRSKDAKVTFRTIAEITLGIGATGVTLTGECAVAGPSGNGYAPGQISEAVDSLAVAFTVSNSSTTTGGTASEDTARLQERFPTAVRGLSVAGPTSAYEHLARAASADVLDAKAISFEPFVMTLFILSTSGAPSPELLELVEASLDPIEDRPGLDELEVVAASPMSWSLEAQLRLRENRKGVDETAADLALALERAEAYADLLRGGLKREAIRSQIFAELQHPNVYSVVLVAPAADVEVDDGEWAECSSVSITVVGYEGDP